jgi:TolA-binding protein
MQAGFKEREGCSPHETVSGACRRRIGPAACALLALLPLLLAGPARTARAGPTCAAVQVHLAAYAGRYQDATRFADTFGDLETLVADGFRSACRGLGLDPEGRAAALRARIHVHVRDADCGRWGLDRAHCRTVLRDGVEHQEIDLFAEYFLSGDSDIVTVVHHEMVHAVMRGRMGRRAYERLPHWIREGLAVQIAEEGPHHLRRTLLAHEDADALLTGLMMRERSLVMYPYAWLAIEFLLSTEGTDGLRRWVARLLRGEDPRRATRSETKSSWQQFTKDVHRHAQARIAQESRGLDTLREARTLYGARRYTEARAAFDRFLDTYPHSAFAPTARYYRARSWYREGRFDEAASAFQSCILTDLGRSGWIDECHLFLGIARHEQRRDKVAVSILRDYIELHPYADQHDLGYLALGRALERLGRPDEARAAFESVARVCRARAPQRRAAARELEALDEHLSPAGR